MLVIGSENACLEMIMLTTTLNRPISVGRNNFLEPTLMLIMLINVGHSNFLTQTRFSVYN